MEPGNIINFGADPSGSTDSSDAIQAAIDSEYPVYIYAGHWRIDKTIKINKPKIIHLEHGLMESNDKPQNFPLGDTHARIFTTKNIDMFEIGSRDVHIYGGTFDTQQVIDHTKAVFKYVFNTGNTI